MAQLQLKWLRSRALIPVALVILIATIAFVLWLSRPVTEANFRKIDVGMSQTDLLSLLGPADSESVEVGLVEGPETYVTNAHMSEELKRARGFQTYQRQQWTSPEITIIVIVDTDERVACRYSSEGRGENPFWFVEYWLSRWF